MKENTELFEYINRIKKIPVLSKAEERRLIKMAQGGNKKAEKKFIEANLKLVVGVVSEFRGLFRSSVVLEPLEFIQEGNIALFRAIKKFDLQKPYRFSTYAAWWIRCAIFKALNSSRTITIQKHVIKTINRYKKVKEILANKEDRMPSTEEIAEKIGISAKKIRKFLRLFWEAGTISIDFPLNDKPDSNTLEDILPDKETLSQEKIVQLKELKIKTRKMLSTLTPREEKILRMRFGIGEKNGHTLRETKNMFSISHERVRQIEAKAIRKLREKLMIGKENFQLDDYL